MKFSMQIAFRKGITMAALLALALNACSTDVDQSAQKPSGKFESLAGTSWQVEDVAAGGVIDNSNLTLNFGEDGRINGSSGCNNYMGDFSVNGDSLEVGTLAGTMMACPPAIMDLEQKFLGVLGDATKFSIDRETSKLTISAADGRTVIASKIQ